MSIKPIVIGCALLTFATSVGAQGWIEAPSVVRERTSVTVRVQNQVASVEVEEWFRNRGGNLGEGDYMFPMPAGAVFASYSLYQGDTEMRGEVLDAAQARRVYEDIVRRKKDPALIELVGHGLIRARVFPIAAGESRRVVLRYTQPLPRAGDALEFRYPAKRANDAAAVSITMNVSNASQFRNAVSPTHTLSVRRDRGEMVVRPTAAVRSDFAVLLPLAERDVGIAMSTHSGSSGDGYFMLRLSPGEVREMERVARDISVVVDVSGSMSGEKIIQAKAALRQLLGTLGREDRFRLIKFSGESREWREQWTQATPAELRAADRWVDDLRADGGTNIGDALADAFRAQSPSTRLSVVVFMTDGLPSVGEQNPERLAAIAERTSQKTRVFAFGVGHDVNTYLLDRLGAAGRGGAQYVQPGESVETALGTLSNKIRFPVLTDLALAASGVNLREIYPTTLPDLFGGEDLVVFGRYRTSSRVARGGPSVDGAESRPGSGKHATVGQITITGSRSGKPERYSTRVTFSGGEDGNDYIPRLWASRKLGELTRRVRLEGRSSELVEEIKSTALRYGLLSEYTSYFVAEPGAMDGMAVTGNRNQAVSRDRVSSRAVTGQTVDALSSRGVAGGKAAAAPPSTGATGSSAVAAAEASRVRREVVQLSQLDSMERAAAREIPTNGLAQVDVKTGGVAGRLGETKTMLLAGRSFMLRDSIWTDAGIRAGQKTIDVLAYSDAYFAILRALPELKPYVTLGDVAIGGSAVTVRMHAVRPGGVMKMTDADVAALVTQFRGAAAKQ